MNMTPKADPPRVLYIGLKVNEPERALLEAEAKARNRSMSEVIRMGVAALADKRKKAARHERTTFENPMSGTREAEASAVA